jgi:hypothetical protein
MALRAAGGADSTVWVRNSGDTETPTLDNVVVQTVNQVVELVHD